MLDMGGSPKSIVRGSIPHPCAILLNSIWTDSSAGRALGVGGSNPPLSTKVSIFSLYDGSIPSLGT